MSTPTAKDTRAAAQAKAEEAVRLSDIERAAHLIRSGERTHARGVMPKATERYAHNAVAILDAIEGASGATASAIDSWRARAAAVLGGETVDPNQMSDPELPAVEDTVKVATEGDGDAVPDEITYADDDEE